MTIQVHFYLIKWMAAAFSNQNDNTYTFYWNSGTDEDMVDYIKSFLKNEFKSIEFIYTSDNFESSCFKFSDQADEAFFLIWSNDSVKI